MSSNDLIPISGVCCAVTNCKQHSGNAIQEGYNISFHRFPKSLQLQNIWAQKCKIVDKWNPKSSYYVCSMHFGRDDFVHDLKAELSGYVPSYRHLKQDIAPTLNLPNDLETSKTPAKCSSSLDAKTAQHIREVLARSFPPSFSSGSVYLLPPTTPSISLCDKDTDSRQKISTATDYKKLYNDVLNECNILKSKNKILLKKVKKKKKESHWTRDKVADAFALMYHSKRAYEYLKNELHYSLPGILSFQRWAKTIEMNNGLIEDVLKIMKLNNDNIEDHEKLTVLIIDELKMCNTIEYDEANDEVIGPHTHMQVVMARGISSNWKQPIFVDFDVNMTKTILFDIIDKLDDIGYKVMCCVSNYNSKNIKLWNQLNLSYEDPSFFIPNGRKIIYIPDSSNLLKLTRNWLLDTGFCLNDVEINKIPLEALITKKSVGLPHNLKKEHLTCEGPQRENIELAKQLLSYSTAIVLQHNRPIDDLELLNDTAEFIKLISNWFDLANVSQTNNRTTFKSPFGMFLYQQNKLLNEFYTTINLMRCKGKNYTYLQGFQEGILMYINGIKQLFQILRENGVKYLLTGKINNDPLNNLFHQICSIDDLPSPLNAVNILKKITLGIYSNDHNKSNTVDHEEFMIVQILKSVNINLSDEDNEKEISERNDSDTISENEFTITNKDEMELDAIEFLAGWVALKYKSKIPEIGCMTVFNESNKDMIPSWMNHLSYNGLMIPSNDFKKIISRVEWLFNKFTKHQIPKGSNVVAKLTSKIFSRMSIEKKFKGAIQIYIKQRIIIRMKYSNYRIQLKKQKKKIQKLD
uniref:Transposable element P transposase n=1 Tax=Melanaphis sacchari TaxID=742174 RepID=A0A2H8TYU1_9HEMI